jgi:putative transcriptional regulator
MNNRIPEPNVSLDLGGQLLVATTNCADSMLQGTVCLILHHGAEGSMGLVLNRAIELDTDGLWKFLNAPEERTSRPIRFGGPVSGPILALHNHKECAEVAAAAGIYIAAHVDKLQQLIASHSGEVRIVVGQVLWKVGQLEHEIGQGMWLPLPATPELVFAPEEEMWRRGMREVGNRYVAMLAGAVLPVNASLN